MKKWNDLATRMLATGKYHKPRVVGELLAAQGTPERSVIREDCSGRITDFVTCWPTPNHEYDEVGSLYVEHAGNGTCGEILAKLVAKTPVSKKLFLITDDPRVIKAAAGLGFYTTMFPTQPLLDAWCRDKGFGKDRIPPEGALVRNVAQAVRSQEKQLLRTLMVRGY